VRATLVPKQPTGGSRRSAERFELISFERMAGARESCGPPSPPILGDQDSGQRTIRAVLDRLDWCSAAAEVQTSPSTFRWGLRLADRLGYRQSFDPPRLAIR
jgi:hypothetical protein